MNPIDAIQQAVSLIEVTTIILAGGSALIVYGCWRFFFS